MTAEEPEIADCFVNENACDEAQSCVRPDFGCETKRLPCPPIGWLPPEEVPKRV